MEASHTQPGYAGGRVVNAIITVVIEVIAGGELPSDSNDPPGFQDQPGSPETIREVAENAPGGTLVGAPVTATDADGDALTYTLSGADAFVIDAATGQIRVADGATLDYETTTSYAVTVSVTDGKDAAGEADPSIDATLDVTINVLDQLPPAKPDAPAVEPSDSEPESVLDVTWTAPANDGRPAITDYDLRYRAEGASQWISHAVRWRGDLGHAARSRTRYQLRRAGGGSQRRGPRSVVGHRFRSHVLGG